MDERKLKRLNKRFGTQYIYLKKSTIRNAGLGAFAQMDIPEGLRLGEYKGRIISSNEASELPLSKSHYLFEIKLRDGKNKFVDARLLKYSNWCRFVNSIKKYHQKKKENVRYYQYNEKIWLKSTRHIKKGEELICDYGDEYWDW
eukprot:64058_1